MDWLNTIFAGIVAGGVLAGGVWTAVMFICKRLDARFKAIEARLDTFSDDHSAMLLALKEIQFEHTYEQRADEAHAHERRRTRKGQAK